jgi:hypothetical protein
LNEPPLTNHQPPTNAPNHFTNPAPRHPSGNTAGKLGDNSIIERHAFVTVSNSTYSSNYAVITPPEAPVTVQETSNDSECKPGNGNGDTNHCHSGAPGKSK